MSIFRNLFGWLVQDDPAMMEEAMNPKIVVPKPIKRRVKITRPSQKQVPEPFADVLACCGDALQGHTLKERITIRKLAMFYNFYCGKYGLRKRNADDLRSLLSKKADCFRDFGFDRYFASDQIAYYFSTR